MITLVKGIKALFSSGVLLSPSVLLGFIYSSFLCKNFRFSHIVEHFKRYELYVLVVIVALFYNIVVKKHYKDGGYGNAISWEATAVASIGTFSRFFVTCYLTISLFNFLFF